MCPRTTRPRPNPTAARRRAGAPYHHPGSPREHDAASPSGRPVGRRASTTAAGQCPSTPPAARAPPRRTASARTAHDTTPPWLQRHSRRRERQHRVSTGGSSSSGVSRETSHGAPHDSAHTPDGGPLGRLRPGAAADTTSSRQPRLCQALGPSATEAPERRHDCGVVSKEAQPALSRWRSPISRFRPRTPGVGMVDGPERLRSKAPTRPLPPRLRGSSIRLTALAGA